MFSNKGFGLKLAAALAIAALQGILSGKWGNSIHPDLSRCLTEPSRWDGTPLWLHGALVIESDSAGFDVDVHGSRARIAPAAAVAPGEFVSIAGTFRAAGPIVEQKELRKEESRRLPEAISIAILVLVFLNLFRHFSFRPESIQVHGLGAEVLGDRKS